MKPKIDINSSKFQFLKSKMDAEVELTSHFDKTVTNAVVPICAILKTRMHRSPKKKPEQIGSGVILNIKNEYFLLSAEHVFNGFRGKAIYTIDGNSQIKEVTGNLFCNENDIFDAAVFHIKNEISPELKKLSISLNDLGIEYLYDKDRPLYMITGFRAKESNTAGDYIKLKRRSIPTIESNRYTSYNIDPKTQIILAYENHLFSNNVWEQSPKPKGMSGGGIIKAQGTTLLNENGDRRPFREVLTAITIEHHKNKGGETGYLVGTKINIHLDLIQKYVPEVFK